MTSTDTGRRALRALGLSGPGVLLGLLAPKCPLCIAAWLGSLGLGGTLALHVAPWLRVTMLLGALLLTAAGTLVLRRRPPSRCCNTSTP